MLRQSFHPTGTESTPRETNPAAAARSSRPLATILHAIGDAWREALTAHRQYEQLTSSGVAHDPALKEALGIRIPAGEVRIAGSRATTGCRSKPHTSDRMRGEAHIGNLTFVQ
jgi:hypothetical protein